MSFFGKIKQFLGIGTVKVIVTGPPTFTVNDGTIKGTVDLNAKSDQEVKSVLIKFVEEWTTGRGDQKSTQEIIMGSLNLPGFMMKAGEAKKINYDIPFHYGKSSNEAMAGKGGVTGALGKVAVFANAEKSKFLVKCIADVKGAALDPSNSVIVKRVG